VIEAKDRPVKGSASPFVVAVDMVMDMELDTSSTLLPCVFIWGQSTTGLGSMERVCGLHRRKQKVVHKVHSRKYTCLSIHGMERYPFLVLGPFLQAKDMRKPQFLRLH